MFERDTLKQDATPEERRASKEFCEVFCHLMSLLHALALQNLRRDWDLKNLGNHHTISSEPTMVSQSAEDQVSYHGACVSARRHLL